MWDNSWHISLLPGAKLREVNWHGTGHSLQDNTSMNVY